MTRMLVWMLCWLCSACSFATLGRVTVEGREVAAASPRIQVIRQGAQQPIEAAMAIEKGDILETGTDASAKVLFAGAEAVLFPRTRVQILNPSIFAWFGEVWLNGLFTTKTEYVVAASKGTEYLVQVDEKTRAVTLIVIEGSVECSSPQSAWGTFVAQRGERVVARGGSAPLERNRLSAEEYNALLVRLNATRLNSSLLVPDVTGLGLERAKTTLANGGLALAGVGQAPVEPGRVGLVVAQSPVPGGRGTSVALTIGARGVRVPDLVRRTQNDASILLTGAGLRLGGVQTEYTGRHPAGSILRQTPGAGQLVVPETPVAITVEAAPVTVPELSGLPLEQVDPRLAQHDLRKGVITEQLSAEHRSKIVLSQTPKAGSTAAPGSKVDLVVAAPGSRVPDLRGLVGSQIDAALANAGLVRGRVSERNADHAAGRVLEQTPLPGILVARGTRVDVVIARAQKQCTVPDARQYGSPNDIRKAFDQAGLRATVKESGSGESFRVESQTPPAGSAIDCGTQVTIVGSWIVG